MPKVDRRDPPQGTLAMVAESIKKAVRQGVNSDIQDTITKLETQQRLPEVRHDVNVTLEGTVKLEAAYVQMHGPLPPTECTECQKGNGPFQVCVFADTGAEKEIMGGACSNCYYEKGCWENKCSLRNNSQRKLSPASCTILTYMLIETVPKGRRRETAP